MRREIFASSVENFASSILENQPNNRPNNLPNNRPNNIDNYKKKWEKISRANLHHNFNNNNSNKKKFCAANGDYFGASTCACAECCVAAGAAGVLASKIQPTTKTSALHDGAFFDDDDEDEDVENGAISTRNNTTQPPELIGNAAAEPAVGPSQQLLVVTSASVVSNLPPPVSQGASPSHHSSIAASSSAYSRIGNSRDYFSAFQQQQQFAFFPNASEKVMANTRRIIVLWIYIFSLVLSILLFLLTAVYCQLSGCSITWAEKNRQYAQLFPVVASCLIGFLSTCWLISNFRRVETSCMRKYSFLEMPSAVFSSLLAGVCAVIEVHYNFDYSYLYWSEKWALAAADSVILVFLHAGLAFALT